MSNQLSPDIRYLLVEDEVYYREKFIEVFSPLGWVLAGEVTCSADVEKLFQDKDGITPTNWKDVHAAVVDDDLGSRVGESIVALLREIAPHIIVIGYSALMNLPKDKDLYFGKSGITIKGGSIDLDEEVRSMLFGNQWF